MQLKKYQNTIKTMYKNLIPKNRGQPCGQLAHGLAKPLASMAFLLPCPRIEQREPGGWGCPPGSAGLRFQLVR
jgi:hypothetical protein